MNIQVSKVFAKFINKTAKEMGFEAHAEVVLLPYEGYSFYTGQSVVDASFSGDYDWETRDFKTIKVTYPDNYYACPVYLTTKGLVEEFRSRGVKTMEELKDMLREMLEV
jgi:hypothetical protein